MFRDNNAFDRSDIVERLKSNGTVVTLSFLSYVLDVVVKDYEPEIDNPFRIDYKITVEVSRDRSGKTTSANTTSADSQISAASKNAVSNYNILAGTNTNVTA
jgi:hypothetical protein